MTQEQLVSALQRRDNAARDEFVHLYGDRLLRSAFILCGNEAEAQDMAQETFLEAFRSIDRFQQRSSVYTWLHSILLNISRQHRRKQGRIVYDNQAALDEIGPLPETVCALDADAAGIALREALRTISEPHREVIALRFYEGMKIHTMAQHLGVSAGTVKSRLHYAIAELKKRLPADLNLFGADDTETMQFK